MRSETASNQRSLLYDNAIKIQKRKRDIRNHHCARRDEGTRDAGVSFRGKNRKEAAKGGCFSETKSGCLLKTEQKSMLRTERGDATGGRRERRRSRALTNVGDDGRVRAEGSAGLTSWCMRVAPNRNRRRETREPS